MSDLPRVRRPGPAPLVPPVVSFAVGMAVSPHLLQPALTMALLGVLSLVVGLTTRGPVRRMSTAAGWLLMGYALGNQGAGVALPARDGPLIVEVELGPAARHPRTGVARRAWAPDGVERSPVWKGPLEVRLGTTTSIPAELGQGSRLLCVARFHRGRDGRVWLSPQRRRPLVRVRVMPVGLIQQALRWSRRRVARVVGRVRSERVRGVFLALALGDRAALDPTLQAAFARTGTAHLLAISGLHVGVWWAVARGGVREVLARLPARWTRGGGALAASAVIGWLGAWGYVALAGAPLSGVRALAMLTAVTAATLIRRGPSPWNVLASAVLAVLLVSPEAIRALGLQLSVASVAFLLAWTPLPARGGSLTRRVAMGLGLSLWTGLLGTAATAPLVASVWGTVPLAGVWTNAFAVPLLGLLTVPLLLLAAGAALVSEELALGLVLLAEFPAGWGLELVQWFAHPSRAPEVVWDPGLGMIAAWYLVAGAVMTRGRLR